MRKKRRPYGKALVFTAGVLVGAGIAHEWTTIRWALRASMSLAVLGGIAYVILRETPREKTDNRPHLQRVEEPEAVLVEA